MRIKYSFWTGRKPTNAKPPTNVQLIKKLLENAEFVVINTKKHRNRIEFILETNKSRQYNMSQDLYEDIEEIVGWNYKVEELYHSSSKDAKRLLSRKKSKNKKRTKSRKRMRTR